MRKGVRRNQITRRDSQFVAGTALVAAAAGVSSPAAPTGDVVVDGVIVAGVCALITWLGASAPWWALVTAAGIAGAASFGGPPAWTAIAATALAAGCWIGWARANQPVLRAAIAGAVTQVVLRIEWNPFFLSSAIVATTVFALIGVTGYLRRQRYVRRRVLWSGMGTALAAVLAAATLGVAGVQASADARSGYTAVLDGLEQLEQGDTLEASITLSDAASDLGAAAERITGPLGRPSQLLPGVAQNRAAATDVLTEAADAAAAAAEALALVDLDRLTVVDGRVDIAALEDLAEPLTQVAGTVDALRSALYEADSPWLIAPMRDRLDRAVERADRVAHQAEATAMTARVAPSLLGADQRRRYLLAFVNNAEARGQSGLMGNWSELTVDDGRMRITRTGRSADLQAESLRSLRLEMPGDYLARYGSYGALSDGGVIPKFWSNVTMPAHMPYVGDPMAQMYRQATGRPVDGVFVVDPVGLAALVELTGPVRVEELDDELGADELQQFLLLEQYEIEEADRERVLESITTTVVDQVLADELPGPRVIAETMSDAALHGHLTAWAVRTEEQALFEVVGMDGSLPDASTPGRDALAVVSNNASGNKIENFLSRTIEYRPVVDQRSGRVDATLRIELTNEAPTSGYDDYVIGNIVDAPLGTNRMLLDVYTRLDVEAVTVDGETRTTMSMDEAGYTTHRRVVDIPAGETVVVEMLLSGNVGAGPYTLAYRPQALPQPDQLSVRASTTSGDALFDYHGEPKRRIVIDDDGTEAWRTDLSTP